MKVRLHRQYGPGLKNVYNPVTKEFDHEEFARVPRLEAQKHQKHRLGAINLPGSGDDSGIYSIGGVKINAAVSSAFVLGWAAGMQYQPDFAGPCFYTITDTVNSLNYFANDYQNLIKYYQWYNLFIYTPTLFYSNLIASYE